MQARMQRMLTDGVFVTCDLSTRVSYQPTTPILPAQTTDPFESNSACAWVLRGALRQRMVPRPVHL